MIDITGQKHDVTQVASDIQMLLGNMPDIENCAEPEILSNENGKVTFRAILSTNYSQGVHNENNLYQDLVNSQVYCIGFHGLYKLPPILSQTRIDL